MMMLLKALSASLLFIVLLAGGAYAGPISEGSYVVYGYSLVWGDRSVSGNVREEVLRDFGNGTIRLRLEATMNDGVLTVEKNAPTSAFHVPRLIRVPEGTVTYSRRNTTITLSVERAGSVEVGVGGRSYVADVYRINLVVEGQWGFGGGSEGSRDRLTLSGILKVIRGSGVIYSFEGAADGVVGGRLEGRVVLLDTNLDLEEAQTADSSSISDAGLSMPVEFIGQYLTMQSPMRQAPTQAQTSSRPDDTSLRALIIVAAGLAALSIAAVVPSRIRPRDSQGREASKPHYV